MLKIRQLLRVIQATRRKDNSNLGDLAILKSDALGAQAKPAVMAQLQTVVGYHPPIDLEVLSHLPKGSLGYEYAQHMKTHQLIPFNVSPELEDVAQRNVFALRYAVTHDIFHVLLGFDTSWAGEIGVLAFAVSQGYSRSLQWGLWIARGLYPILAPGQIKQIFANQKRGWQLGQQASFMLGYRFEAQWEKPLQTVKLELGLPT